MSKESNEREEGSVYSGLEFEGAASPSWPGWHSGMGHLSLCILGQEAQSDACSFFNKFVTPAHGWYHLPSHISSHLGSVAVRAPYSHSMVIVFSVESRASDFRLSLSTNPV